MQGWLFSMYSMYCIKSFGANLFFGPSGTNRLRKPLFRGQPDMAKKSPKVFSEICRKEFQPTLSGNGCSAKSVYDFLCSALKITALNGVPN